MLRFGVFPTSFYFDADTHVHCEHLSQESTVIKLRHVQFEVLSSIFINTEVVRFDRVNNHSK